MFQIENEDKKAIEKKIVSKKCISVNTPIDDSLYSVSSYKQMQYQHNDSYS